MSIDISVVIKSATVFAINGSEISVVGANP
jgi:hypothetical protein